MIIIYALQTKLMLEIKILQTFPVTSCSSKIKKEKNPKHISNIFINQENTHNEYKMRVQ